MNEKEMREATPESPKTIEELANYIKTLVEQKHDYGTCVYAMSHAAVAAFNYVAFELGVTGFQASCADLDILRHTRNLKHGRVLDFGDLLYPQYEDRFNISFQSLIDENIDWLAQEAQRRLSKATEHTHRDVLDHWRMLVDKKKV